MASVAILLFTSVMRFSKSRLQVITDCGCIIATLLSVRTAANRNVGRGELKKSWSTEKKLTDDFPTRDNLVNANIIWSAVRL